MEIILDSLSAVPLYQQIADRLRRLVTLGVISPQDRLPSVRELARLAHVNRNTAARAIKELKQIGIVRTCVGQGTFIVESIPTQTEGDCRDQRLNAVIDSVIVDSQLLGVPLEELGWKLNRRVGVFMNRSASVSDPKLP